MWCSLVKTIGSRTEQTIHQVLLRLACGGQRGRPGQAGKQQNGVRRAAYPRFIAYLCDEEGGDDTLPCVVQTGSVSCRVQARSKVQQGAATAKPGGHEALKR